MLSIIIPACQEEDRIEACLASLLAQSIFQERSTPVEVIVVANGCTDGTVAVAQSWMDRFRAAGISLQIVELDDAGKALALNAGDRRARGTVRAFLDADVLCSPDLLRQIVAALDTPAPRLASGTLTLFDARSRISRAYGRLWTALPFVRDGVASCGFYAVNAAGRLRWGEFPAIHSDDKFVRLNFAPEERIRVRAPYRWPLPEGLSNLVRVRRRWCEGNDEFARRYPQMARNEDRAPRLRSLRSLLGRARLEDLTVFLAVYATAFALARLTPSEGMVRWRRGR